MSPKAQPPLTVLHLETGRHLYGGALQVYYLIHGSARLGLRNLLICPEGSRIQAAVRDLAHVLPVRYRGELDPRLGIATIAAIRRHRPDLVHVHSRRGADWWGGAAARRTGVPAIISRRVDNPEPSRLGRGKYRLFDRVISISQGIRQMLVNAGVPAAKIVCVPSGIPVDAEPAACDRSEFLAAFGLPPDAFTVAVVAQLIPRKGHRFLIQALPAILSHCPTTRLLFFGRGPAEADLRRSCAAAGLSDRVRFAGFRPDVQRFLPCIDVIAHPATMEGLGIALLEAAAARRPLVAAAVGGIPEIVLDGETGLLVPPGEPQALAAAVIRLLSDPDLRARLGRRGRELVQQRFSIRAMVAGNLAVYTDLLGEARCPRPAA